MNAVIEIPLVLLLAIIIHELTHYFFANLTGNFIKIDFDEGSPTVHFDDQMSFINQLMMYGLAILSGLIVIILFIFFSVNGIIHLITAALYLFGCSFDIYQIFNLIIKENN